MSYDQQQIDWVLPSRNQTDTQVKVRIQNEDITLVSADAIFRQYNDVAIVWAANS